MRNILKKKTMRWSLKKTKVKTVVNKQMETVINITN